MRDDKAPWWPDLASASKQLHRMPQHSLYASSVQICATTSTRPNLPIHPYHIGSTRYADMTVTCSIVTTIDSTTQLKKCSFATFARNP